MRSVKVRLGSRAYRIEIGSGLLDSAGDRIRRALGDRPQNAVLVTNPSVGGLYGQPFRSSLKRAGFKVHHLCIGDGERYKSLKSAESVYTELIERHIERKDVVIALGGGVIGDLAGFVAGTYLRGLKYVQVPTTLLAQIDSSIGGKTGVNHGLGKNLIGVFHQPASVIIDPAVLETLPDREMSSGLFEAIKYGVIRDRKLFGWTTSNILALMGRDGAKLERLIGACCAIKAAVVAEDETEQGLRRILNFGHTVGHAIEAVTHYRRFKHGEAVGIGMRSAARIAELMGILNSSDRVQIEAAIGAVGAIPSARNLAFRDIMRAMMRDKKSERGNIAFVLPHEIGKVAVRSDVPLSAVRQSLVETLG